MTINEAIYTYLSNRRSTALAEFEPDSPLSEQLFASINSISIEEVKQQFYKEILSNCEDEWVLYVDLIDGLLFEYDYAFRENEQADAYGIIYEGFRMQAEPYNIGSNYNFGAGFACVPGITLRLMNPLTAFTEAGMPVMNGYAALKDSYFFTAFLALHLALTDFVQTEAFAGLKHKLPFHFLIQEHDSGVSYPVCVVE